MLILQFPPPPLDRIITVGVYSYRYNNVWLKSSTLSDIIVRMKIRWILRMFIVRLNASHNVRCFSVVRKFSQDEKKKKQKTKNVTHKNSIAFRFRFLSIRKDNSFSITNWGGGRWRGYICPQAFSFSIRNHFKTHFIMLETYECSSIRVK